jgi:hypothetical protein
MHAYKFTKWYQSIKVIRWHGPACWLRVGMSRNGIRAKRDVQEVTLPDLLVVGDVTNIGGFKRESCSVVGERYRIPIERDICVDRRSRVLRANKKAPDRTPN